MTDDTSDLLARAKAGDAAPEEPVRARGTAKDAAKRRSTILKIVVVLGLLSAGVAALVGSESSPFVYSRMVGEVVENPEDWQGRTLRVEGQLANGSVRFREDPCEWRFTLEESGRQMPVEFSQCVVPDTFRDGMGISVVVEGQIREDGSFVASQVIPRCPSRYEMDQRQQAGEAMPHGAPPPSS